MLPIQSNAPPLAGTARRERAAVLWGLAWAILLAVAGGLRFAALDASPAGLWFDEALNGENTLLIRSGERPIFFYPEGYPQEPLYFYLQAAMCAAFDEGQTSYWPLRATSALIGLLTLPAFFFFARELMPRRWALFATAILAFHPWHVHFSRLGFRTVMTPLMVSLIGWALVGWTRRGGLWRAGLAAFFLGAALYTYTAANALVPAVALFLGLAWFGHPTSGPARSRRRHWAGVAVGLGVALAVFAPLGLHYLRDEAFTSRLRAVGPGAEGFSLSRNFLATALFFFVQGDPIFKHGPPFRPLFPFATGAFFVAGLAWATWSWRKRGGGWLYVLLTLVGFLAASLFSFQAPNKLRSLGAAPAVILLFAQGVRLAVDAARRLGAKAWLTRTVVGVGCALVLFGEAKAVIYDWHGSPAIHDQFNQTQTEIAKWARGEATPGAESIRVPGLRFFVPYEIANHASIRFLTAQAPGAVTPLKDLAAALESGKSHADQAIYLLVTALVPENARVLRELDLPMAPVASFGSPNASRPFATVWLADLRSLPSKLSDEQRALAAQYECGH